MQPELVEVNREKAEKIADVLRRSAKKSGNLNRFSSLGWMKTIPQYLDDDIVVDMYDAGDSDLVTAHLVPNNHELSFGDNLFLDQAEAEIYAEKQGSIVKTYQFPPYDLVRIGNKVTWSPRLVRDLVGSVEEMMNGSHRVLREYTPEKPKPSPKPQTVPPLDSESMMDKMMKSMMMTMMMQWIYGYSGGGYYEETTVTRKKTGAWKAVLITLLILLLLAGAAVAIYLILNNKKPASFNLGDGTAKKSGAVVEFDNMRLTQKDSNVILTGRYTNKSKSEQTVIITVLGAGNDGSEVGFEFTIEAEVGNSTFSERKPTTSELKSANVESIEFDSSSDESGEDYPWENSPPPSSNGNSYPSSTPESSIPTSTTPTSDNIN